MSKYLYFLFFSLNIFSQNDRKIIHVDREQDYLLLLDNETKISHQTIDNANLDVFVNANKDTFNYNIIITRIHSSTFSDGGLLEENYEKYLTESCNCTLLEPEIVLYNNLRSLRFLLKTKKENNNYMGYIDSFVSNSVLYNVLFLTLEDKFEMMRDQYISTINTLFINGRSTIDYYKEYK